MSLASLASEPSTQADASIATTVPSAPSTPPPPALSSRTALVDMMCGAMIGGSLAITTSTSRHGGGDLDVDEDDRTVEQGGRIGDEAQATWSLLQVDDDYDTPGRPSADGRHHHRHANGHHTLRASYGMSGGGGRTMITTIYRHYPDDSDAAAERAALHATTDIRSGGGGDSSGFDDLVGSAAGSSGGVGGGALGLGGLLMDLHDDDVLSHEPHQSGGMTGSGWRDDEDEAEARERLEKVLRDQQRFREEELMELQRVYTKAIRKNFRSLRGMPEPNFDAPSALYEEELDALAEQDHGDGDDATVSLGAGGVVGMTDGRSPSTHQDCHDPLALRSAALLRHSTACGNSEPDGTPMGTLANSSSAGTGALDVLPPPMPVSSNGASSTSSRHRMQGLVYAHPSSDGRALCGVLDGTHIHTTHGGGTQGQGGVAPRGFVSRLRRCRVDDEAADDSSNGFTSHASHQRRTMFANGAPSGSDDDGYFAGEEEEEEE